MLVGTTLSTSRGAAQELRLDLSAGVAWIFIGAMVTRCSPLLSFPREIFIATRHLRIGGP